MWSIDDLAVTTVSRTLAFGRLNRDPDFRPDHVNFWKKMDEINRMTDTI